MVEKGLSIKKKSKRNDTNMHRYRIPELIDKLICGTDILLEDLDARFIEQTRKPRIEKRVRQLGKKLIFILNKADLADIDTITREVELHKLKPYVFFSCKNQMGKGNLKEFIRKESEGLCNEAVNLGIVGYPNTGKSSIINMLSGKSAAKTSSQAGFTRGIQKVKLSEGIYLIDTPGIIPINERLKQNPAYLIKHSEIGAKSWDKTKEPEMVVHKILGDYPGVLEAYYDIQAGGDSEILIEELGKRLSYLKKGGIVDTDRTARKILRDWQEGKIKLSSIKLNTLRS